jgi:hypothetical protein
VRFVSYGGGVQSTALLVLAAAGRIDYPRFVLANVGDDSEHPATLAYVRDVAAPYAAAHGITLDVVDRVKRDGTVETLLGRLTREGSRSLPIPVRMSNGAPGNRTCTSDFKIRVLAKWAKAHGATASDPATVGIGISLDEIHRANNRRAEPYERVVYPLISVGDDTGLHLTRQDCKQLIIDAGLPVPPKSACWFCPFHRPATWDDMARNDPVLFARAADLEDLLNRRRDLLGKDHVYLARFGLPLRDITDADQLTMFEASDDPGCDSGYCMT